ncbi:DUF1642 domain-containing protein [Lactococcus petauri]|uniref:DUF1642 domain-containing protein n=1 Tax=Lactococcus petauri TaxID=1940789 RepID=UPI001BCC6799|nr:DUF1642 domain-containing protein [Lactococcus petauri]MBS4460511.1 DUF1642 domain-containing protein [Lactococcus petauri]
MKKFEEEVKRPSNAGIDPFSKRDVSFEKLSSKFTKGAQTLKEWKEYAFKAEDKIRELESQLKKQQPEIPEFVAKYIEKYKGARTVYGILDKISRNQKVYPKLYEWVFKNEERQEIFAQAWLNGYTVEKPQMFEVKMPIVYWDDDASQLTNGFEFLRIDKETDEVDFIGFLSNTKKHTVYFTEQEIKSIDERYWQFAVPVEEEK